MDEVGKILSGEYGICQPGMSTPMASSNTPTIVTLPTSNDRSTNPAISTDLRYGVLEQNSALSSPKKDDVLESLGMGLTETKGLGFEELVYVNMTTDDPFLFFETGYPSFHKSCDESDVFDIHGCNGISASSFTSEGNGNRGKDCCPSAHQNPKERLLSSYRDSNPNISATKPPILDENFEFFSMHETAEDEKEMGVKAARNVKNKSYNGIDAFFSDIGLGGRCPPMQMEATLENIFDAPFKMGGASGGAQGVPTDFNLVIKKSSSIKNRVDDLFSGIGVFQPPSEFQGIDGDNEHRRQARYEREQRKFERAAKALAEKNEHDFDLERELIEREMIAEELNAGVKQWAAGREGNLRALISTLEDVLWPECGWHPVSLGNLMTSAAVKKAYAKAALCVHPDKVQQKGATLRQKYIAEKVFYLLTEALNKFCSEELS